MNPTETSLSNGIPVIFQPFEGMVASAYWWVNVGSESEQPREYGFAHFLEHMNFKDSGARDTGRPSTGQLAQAIESRGGDINAYTSFEQTVYHVTCAEQHWEGVTKIFSEMGVPQKFLKADFEREREVILEELRRFEDSPDRQLFQSLFSATFGSHAYGRPVIGYERILKKAKRSELEAFYRQNYVPSKMGIIMVGPLTDSRQKKLLSVLEKSFGKIREPKSAAKPAKGRAVPAKPIQLRNFDVQTPTVAFSFGVPEVTHHDLPALDILSSTLNVGEVSRLAQELFYKRAVVTDVSGGLYALKSPGMMFTQLSCEDDEKTLAAFEAGLEVIENLKNETPSQEELDRVIHHAESERTYSYQTADGVAGRLGFLKFGLGDLGFDERFLQQLKSIKTESLKAIAQQYLCGSEIRIAGLLPKGSQLKIADFKERTRKLSARPKTVSAKTTTSLTPPLLERPSGLRWIHVNRPQSPVFSVYFSRLGGVRLEPSQPVGMGYFLGQTWTKGTAKKNSREISSIVERYSAELDGFSGRNSTGLEMTGLAKDWEPLSELFLEVVSEPSFPDDEIEHTRRVTLDSIRSIRDHSAQLCSSLFLEALFQDHPYGRLIQGTEEAAQSVKAEDVRALYQSWMNPKSWVLSFSGSLPKEAVEEWLSRLEEKLSGENRGASTSALSLSRLKAPRWVHQVMGREQRHIIMGGHGLDFENPDRYALRLLQTILGGQSGRLFLELRERKSLAYTVSPMSVEGIEPGYLGSYIACAPEKQDEALKGMTGVFEELSKKGPKASEMNRAREFYLGRRAMELQGDSVLASFYAQQALFRGKITAEKEIASSVRKISPKDIQRVCKKYFIDPPLVTAVT